MPQALTAAPREGDAFPPCRLSLLDHAADRAYLGLDPEARGFTLADVDADYVLVAVFNSMCQTCREELPLLSDVANQIKIEPPLGTEVRIIGLGLYETRRAVMRLRHDLALNYPLFADRHGDTADCLGEATLPLFFLVRNTGEQRIVLFHEGYLGEAVDFAAQLRERMAADQEAQGVRS